MEYLETLVEKMTFEAARELLAAFEQQHGGQMPAPPAAFLRGHGGARRNLQVRNCFRRSPRSACERIFLDHSRAHRCVRKGVNQDEAARRSIAGIRIKEERQVGFELNRTNF